VAQWQPIHAQTILGSIPEEFQGTWCWQENAKGEEIFRPGNVLTMPQNVAG
jgi:hypothetical protein